MGKVVPELTGGSSLGYKLVGVGYGVLGVAFIAYGLRRQRDQEAALLEGLFVPLGHVAATAFAVAGIVLGVATVAVVIA